jgi:V8-like Glu-specific endopeptidase
MNRPSTTSATDAALRAGTVAAESDIFEKLIGDNNLRPVVFLAMGVRAASPVCQITVFDQVGTGFLIAPNIMMTNNHVIRSLDEGANSSVRFNYELDHSGRLRQPEQFACRPDIVFYTSVPLDFTIIGIEGNPGEKYGFIPLDATHPIRVGSRVNILQHPMGQHKQIACTDNQVMAVGPQVIQYLTDTMPGSSGAPVFNDNWQIVALHHSGGWIPEPNSRSTHFRNEGIRIAAIINDLIEAGLAQRP